MSPHCPMLQWNFHTSTPNNFHLLQRKCQGEASSSNGDSHEGGGGPSTGLSHLLPASTIAGNSEKGWKQDWHATWHSSFGNSSRLFKTSPPPNACSPELGQVQSWEQFGFPRRRAQHFTCVHSGSSWGPVRTARNPAAVF